jgi:hypothetical protein
MTDSDELYTEMEIGDDLSSALGTETLIDRDLIPPGFANALEPEQKACQSRFSIIVDT